MESNGDLNWLSCNKVILFVGESLDKLMIHKDKTFTRIYFYMMVNLETFAVFSGLISSKYEAQNKVGLLQELKLNARYQTQISISTNNKIMISTVYAIDNQVYCQSINCLNYKFHHSGICRMDNP